VGTYGLSLRWWLSILCKGSKDNDEGLPDGEATKFLRPIQLPTLANSGGAESQSVDNLA